MTEATVRALEGIRDFSTLKWYVIPILAFIFYIYVREMKEAKKTGNWDAILAGLTLFGVDFVNETWNGWVMVLSGHSACWTAPGETALRTMVGWNIEIMFMFMISGIIYYHTLSESTKEKIFGVPEKWFWAIVYAAFCVFVEWFLNVGGHLVWEYSFWNRSFTGIWLIFLFGYFHFYCAIIWVITRRTMRAKLMIVGGIYAVAIIMNILGFGVFGWNY